MGIPSIPRREPDRRLVITSARLQQILRRVPADFAIYDELLDNGFQFENAEPTVLLDLNSVHLVQPWLRIDDAASDTIEFQQWDIPAPPTAAKE